VGGSVVGVPRIAFAEPVNDDASPREASEPMSNYLARSTAGGAREMRAWLNESLMLVPIDELVETLGRLRGTDVGFRSAVWELACVRVLEGLGHQLEWHPDLPGTSKRPDWLVTAPDGTRYFFEASVVEEEPTPHDNQIYDALNKVVSQDFWFWPVRVTRTGPASPKVSDLRRAVTRHLQTLTWTPDEAEHSPLNWKAKGWEVEIGFKAKSASARVKPGRPLAIWFGNMEQSKVPGQLRTKLDDKGRKYGDLDLPFVVAIQILGYPDWREVDHALFGTEEVVFPATTWRRQNNGMFRVSSALHRVSTALVAARLNVFAAEGSDVRAWENPKADHPVDSVLLPFARCTWDEASGKVTETAAADEWDRLMRMPVTPRPGALDQAAVCRISAYGDGLVVLDTNVLMEVLSVGDLFNFTPTDPNSMEKLRRNPDFRCLQLRAKYSTLLAWHLAGANRPMLGIQDEGVRTLTENVAPRNGGAVEAFTGIIIHQLLDDLYMDRLIWLGDAEYSPVSNEADWWLLRLADQLEAPLISNEGVTAEGISDRKKNRDKNIRYWAAPVGASVHAPVEYLSVLGVDIDRLASAFVEAVSDCLRSAVARGVIPGPGALEAASRLIGVYRFVMLDEVDDRIAGIAPPAIPWEI
jgi:hypothetical protein